jgi:hypothetical protein
MQIIWFWFRHVQSHVTRVAIEMHKCLTEQEASTRSRKTSGSLWTSSILPTVHFDNFNFAMCSREGMPRQYQIRR